MIKKIYNIGDNKAYLKQNLKSFSDTLIFLN